MELRLGGGAKFKCLQTGLTLPEWLMLKVLFFNCLAACVPDVMDNSIRHFWCVDLACKIIWLLLIRQSCGFVHNLSDCLTAHLLRLQGSAAQQCLAVSVQIHV